MPRGYPTQNQPHHALGWGASQVLRSADSRIGVGSSGGGRQGARVLLAGRAGMRQLLQSPSPALPGDGVQNTLGTNDCPVILGWKVTGFG